MRLLRTGFALLALALIVIAPEEARAVDPGNVTLRDGWTVISEQDPGSLLAQIRIVVRSGSLSDPQTLPGLANFTARALLRGTQTRPFQELTQAIEQIGATVTVKVDQTQTVISGTVIARNLDPFLDILRDVLSQPAFDVREMDILQKLLEGELRSELQDVRTLAARAALGATYPGTSGIVSPDGTVDGISHITPFDLSAFYKSKYVRQNMVVAIASPLGNDVAVQKILSKLDTVPSGNLDATALPPDNFHGRHAVIVSRLGMSTVPVFVVVPGVSDEDPDLSALEVGNFVFGADFTSRLMQVLRAENGWTYGAYSSFGQLIRPKRQPGLFSLYTFPSVGSAAPAIAKAMSMLEDYAKSGVSDAEFAAARDALENRYPFAIDTAEKRLALRVRELLTGHHFDTVSEYRSRLDALTPVAVNATIAHHTETDDLIIAAVGDPDVLRPILQGLPGVQSVAVIGIQP